MGQLVLYSVLGTSTQVRAWKMPQKRPADLRDFWDQDGKSSSSQSLTRESFPLCGAVLD